VLGRGFRDLWRFSLVSNLGDGVWVTALPLLAATLTRDPTAVAGVAVAAELPWLLVSLAAGAIADRVDRRVLMVRVQYARLVAIALFAAAVAAGWMTLPLLYCSVFVLASAQVLVDTAAPTLLPRLVERPALAAANARLFGIEMATNGMVGRPVGGLLSAVAPAVPFVATALSYGGSALLLRRLPGTFRPTVHDSDDSDDSDGSGVRRSMRAHVADGLRWVWRQPLIRTITLVVTFMNLARAMTMSIFVLYALELLRLDGVGFGILTSAVAVGAVTGSLVNAWAGTRAAGPVLVAAVLAHGATTVTMGLTSSPWVAGAASAGFGFAVMTWSVLTASVRQSVVPDELLGRVGSVHRFVSWGAAPLGAVLGGVLAAALGLRAPLVIGGAAVIVAAVVFARSLAAAGAALDPGT